MEKIIANEKLGTILLTALFTGLFIMAVMGL